MSTAITTGKVRFSYCHLFQPHANNDGQEPKYSMMVLVDKSDKKTIAAIKSAIDEAKMNGKTSKWNGKIPTNLKTPLRDGDEEHPDEEVYKGKLFFNCSAKQRPGIVDRDINAILDPDEVYSGCYGRVNVTFYPYDASGNRGVAAGLNHVQKLSDGERLGGGVSVETAFSDAFEDEEGESWLD